MSEEHCNKGTCVAPFYCHCMCLACRELRIVSESRKDAETLRRMIEEERRREQPTR